MRDLERCPVITRCQHRKGHRGLHEYDNAAGYLLADFEAKEEAKALRQQQILRAKERDQL